MKNMQQVDATDPLVARRSCQRPERRRSGHPYERPGVAGARSSADAKPALEIAAAAALENVDADESMTLDELADEYELAAASSSCPVIAPPKTAGTHGTTRFNSVLRRASFSGVRSMQRRVSFRSVVVRIVGASKTVEELRPPDIGKYYPCGSDGKRENQLEKLPVAAWDDERTNNLWIDNRQQAFCECRGRCGARCQCAQDGIGCWFEKGTEPEFDMGCACRGRCSSSVPGFFCDLNEIQRIRKARLSEIRRASAALAPEDSVGEALTSAAFAPEDSMSVVEPPRIDFLDPLAVSVSGTVRSVELTLGVATVSDT